MNNTLIIGIILIFLGLRSIWAGINKKKQVGWMMPSQTYLTEKIFGEKGSGIFWNYFWGIIEFFVGIFIVFQGFKQ